MEVRGYAADWAAARLGDEALRELQTQLAANPAAGSAVPDAGGARKLRIAASGRGKRGGARVWFAAFPERGWVLLLAGYAKNERDDLSAAERRGLAAALVRFGKGLE